jgi:hypothetical protein
MCIVHVLHKHIQCFCPAGGTVYAAQQLCDFCLSNRLEDFEDDSKVGFLKQSRLVSHALTREVSCLLR